MKEKSKIEYLAKMLNSRTEGKSYENFVINSIYTKLNNPELRPVTQQFVHNKEETSGHKHYFLDLYFPQINYGIEVDEGHHHELNQILKDEIREENIFVATGIEEGRIKIFEDDGRTFREYSDIQKQIDEQVKIINKKIEKLKKPLKWLSREEDMKLIWENGVLDINYDFDFGGITEILNFFEIKTENGTPFINYRKAYRKNIFEGYHLWVPHWSKRDNDGNWNARNGWINYPNEDKSEITEIYQYNSVEEMEHWRGGEQDEGGKKRIVFMHMKDKFGQDCTRFIGIFKLCYVSYSPTYGERINSYIRIDTKFKFKK